MNDNPPEISIIAPKKAGEVAILAIGIEGSLYLMSRCSVEGDVSLHLKGIT